MTFEELATAPAESFTDMDGRLCPRPSLVSIAAAREIHDAVLALGPVPQGAELEVDYDVDGGCAVTLRGPNAGSVWFCITQDGGRMMVSTRRREGSTARLSTNAREDAAAARAFMGWPLLERPTL